MIMVFGMLKPFLYPRILTSVFTNKIPGLDGLREHCRTLCCHCCVFQWGALSIHSRSRRRDVWQYNMSQGVRFCIAKEKYDLLNDSYMSTIAQVAAKT